jgi:hypothetical protein
MPIVPTFQSFKMITRLPLFAAVEQLAARTFEHVWASRSRNCGDKGVSTVALDSLWTLERYGD